MIITLGIVVYLLFLGYLSFRSYKNTSKEVNRYKASD